MSLIAKMPKAPYDAVIFSNHLNDDDSNGSIEAYAEMADRMVELASQQEGYLDMESAREELEIIVFYWSDL